MPFSQTALRDKAARVAEGAEPLTLLRLAAVPAPRVDRKGRLHAQGMFTDLQTRWIVGRPGARWKVWKRPGDAKWRARLSHAHKAELAAIYGALKAAEAEQALAASLF